MSKNISRLPENDQISLAETAHLLELAQTCLSVSGDFVELGCYKGDTSVLLGQLLQSASPDSPNLDSVPAPKTLWIYDSFAGLPEKTAEDFSGAGQNFQKGQLLVTKRDVVAKLRRANLGHVIVKKAWFSDLTSADLPSQIAFAFLDGDLYQSIQISLQLVVPRLTRSGLIVVHDYNNPALPGSARAVDKFLRSHPHFHLQVFHTLAILSASENSQSPQ